MSHNPESESDTSSDSEHSSQNDSEYNFIADYVFEDEQQQNGADDTIDQLEYAYAYQDEPLADEEWVSNYQHKVKEQKKKQEELEKRLHGIELVGTW